MKLKEKKFEKDIKYYDEFVIVNSDINQKYINKRKKEIQEFIINSGKVIISLNYNQKIQILIGSLNILNDECYFILSSFIDFKNFIEMEFFFEKLQNINLENFFEQIRKDNYKIFGENNINEIGVLYILDEKEKSEFNIKENNGEENVVKYLVELYFSFDNPNFYIKDNSKIILSQENYYLINKGWINYLNKCYNYDAIIKIIKNNEKNKDLIKKNRELYSFQLKQNEINYIVNQIPEGIKNDINNSDKDYDISLFKSFRKNIKEENNEIYYYDDYILIDEKIKNILQNLNSIKYKFNINVNCFIDFDNRVFVFYKLNNNFQICIGKLNKDNIFETNIIMSLTSEKYYKNYYNRIIIKKEIPPFLNNLKKETAKVKNLKNMKNKIIGILFLLDNFKKEEIYSEEIQIKEKNKKSTKDEIKNLVNYYLFNIKLYEDIEFTRKNLEKKIINYKSSKYYLISSNFMDTFRNHYINDELISFLDNKLTNISSNYDDLLINQISEELFNLDLYKKFENNINNNLIIGENIFDFEFDIIKNDGIDITYPKNFEIIDINFFNNFIKRIDKNYENKIIEIDFIINNGVIIIK